MPRKRREQSDNYNKAFPTALRTLMDYKKTTQNELAEYLQKTRQAVSYYCDGSSSPDWETLVKIADFFDISTDYLLGRTDVKTPTATVRAIADETGLSENSICLLQNFAKPCDPNRKISITGTDYLIWNYGEYSSDLINDFIEYAFSTSSIPDMPIIDYLNFRQQVESSIKYAERRADLQGAEADHQAYIAVNTYSAAIKEGMFPLSADDAAILFRKIFCDKFSEYLNAKYPACKHPLNFSLIGRSLHGNH